MYVVLQKGPPHVLCYCVVMDRVLSSSSMKRIFFTQIRAYLAPIDDLDLGDPTMKTSKHL